MKRKHKKLLYIAAELYLIIIGIILLRDVTISSPTNAIMLIIAAILCIITGILYMAGTFGVKINSLTLKRILCYIKRYLKNQTKNKETKNKEIKEPLKTVSNSKQKKEISQSENSGKHKIKTTNLRRTFENENEYEEWSGVQENSAKDNIESITMDFTEDEKIIKHPQIKELKIPENSDTTKSSDTSEQITAKPESTPSANQINEVPKSEDLEAKIITEIPKEDTENGQETDNIEELEKLAETKILESLDELLSGEIAAYEEDAFEQEEDKSIADGEEWEEL